MGQHLPEYGQSGDLHAAALSLLRVPETSKAAQELFESRQEHGGQVKLLES